MNQYLLIHVLKHYEWRYIDTSQYHPISSSYMHSLFMASKLDDECDTPWY